MSCVKSWVKAGKLTISRHHLQGWQRVMKRARKLINISHNRVDNLEQWKARWMSRNFIWNELQIFSFAFIEGDKLGRGKFVEEEIYRAISKINSNSLSYDKIFHKTIEIPIRQRAGKDESTPTMFAPNNQLFYEFNPVRWRSLTHQNLRSLQRMLTSHSTGKTGNCVLLLGVAWSMQIPSRVPLGSCFDAIMGRYLCRHSEHTRRWRIRDAGSRSQPFAAT